MVEDLALTYRDFADSLKLEVSMLPPEKERHIKEAVNYVKEMIERRYGKYFGPDTLNKVRGLEDRVVTFYPKGLAEYLKMAGSNLEERLKFVRGLHADERMGDIIGITSKKELAEQPEIKETIKIICNQPGISKKKVKEVVVTAALQHNLIHEIFHAYEAPRLPNYFDECAVPYFVSQVQEEVGGFSLYSLEGDPRGKFYIHLIDKFGDEVNGLFFGSIRNKEFKKKILGAYGPRVLKRLFPDGYGTTKRELRKFGM